MKIVTWAEASEILVRGGVVGLPTDTVYGLAAAVSHPAAVRSLFDVKQRPSTTALPRSGPRRPISIPVRASSSSVPW